MGLDLLSDALSMVRLSGAVIFRVAVNGPWCITAAPTLPDFAPALPAGTNHLVAFHILLGGECWLRRPPDQAARGGSPRRQPVQRGGSCGRGRLHLSRGISARFQALLWRPPWDMASGDLGTAPLRGAAANRSTPRACASPSADMSRRRWISATASRLVEGKGYDDSRAQRAPRPPRPRPLGEGPG